MKLIYLYLSLFLLNANANVLCQIPPDFYNTSEGKIKDELKTSLYQRTSTNHSSNSYTSLWTYFQKTDKKSNGEVWDMYSTCGFVFVADQCGSFDSECTCYNREHSVPLSWIGGSYYPMYADLHHLVPVDAWTNNKRSSNPFGRVGSTSWTSNNGSKLGTSNYPGYSGTVFEPINEYKGDFARIMFYMITRYENLIVNWPQNDASAAATLDGNTWPGLKQWAVSLYLEWHEQDPVSSKEIARNDSIYKIQGNRNPFIDRPEFAEQIWSPDAMINSYAFSFEIYPNPTNQFINITSINRFDYIEVFDVFGRIIFQEEVSNNYHIIDVSSFEEGLYFLNLKSDNSLIITKPIIKYN